MQRQLKILDQQLNSNNLTRVPSSLNRTDKSFFRALSLSIYFNQDHIDDIIRILRLCLISTCGTNNQTSFSSPHRKAKFLNKFSHNQQIIDMYIQNPDANCFANDNLEIASLAFIKKIILFTVTKDSYLQQTIITTCQTKTKQPPIMIAKISNRYYCVQSQSTRSVMMFIRENLINRLMNLQQKHKDPQDNGQQYHKIHNYPKIQKKSLSDCVDITQFNLGIQDKTQQIFNFYDGTQSQNIQNYHHNYEGYQDYLYHSDYLINQQKLQRDVIPNQRYCGRLKFFQQSGNYGFIVVDGYGTDLFVHFDDLQKTGIAKDKLLNIRNSQQIRFEFTCLQYDGKYKKSKKAVDLKPIPNDY